MLLRAAERYVYGADGPSSSGVQTCSRAHAESATWLVEVSRRLVRCDRAGLAATDERSAKLRPLATSGVAVEASKAWWRAVRRAVSKHTRLDPAGVPPLDGDHIILAAGSSRMDARTGCIPEMVERPLLIAPVRVGGHTVAVLAADGLDGADPTLTQIVPLARAMARLAAVVLGERLLRDDQDLLRSRIARMERERDALNEALAAAAHEVRQPLTAMRLSVQSAGRALERVRRTEGLSGAAERSLSKASDYLALADRQVSRSERLVDVLTEMARPLPAKNSG